jgi:hypothetical protein
MLKDKKTAITLIKFLLFPLLCLVFCFKIFNNIEYWGLGDWDQHFFYLESPITVIKKYGQLPLWNPWYMGGMVLFQNSQVIFLTPFTLLLFFFDTPVAIKVSIWLHYVIALSGMHMVANRLFHIQNVFLSLIGASIFVFNSFISMQITEGHTWILSFAYIPWVYYFFESYVKSKNWCYLVSSAIGISLMIFEGGIYPVPLLVLFLCCYAFFQCFCYFDRAYLLGLIDVGILSLLLAAVKIIPLLDYMLEYPRLVSDIPSIPLTGLFHIFLGRGQYLGLKLFNGQIEDWHEYGCYIGYFLLLIVIIAIVYVIRRIETERLSISILLCGVLFFSFFLGGYFHGLAPYGILHRLPIFSSMSESGRFLILLTFCCSLLVFNFFGHKEYAIKHLGAKHRSVIMIGVAISAAVILFDLFMVNTRTFARAFTINPKNIDYFTDEFKYANEFHLVFKIPSYGARSSMYPGLRMNVATFKGYEPNAPRSGFVYNQPLVFSYDDDVQISNIIFSPNKITFDANIPSSGIVYLNQNYVHGWKISDSHLHVMELEHKPAVRLSQGKYQNMSFYYFPNSIYIGTIISFLGIISCFLLVKKRMMLNDNNLFFLNAWMVYKLYSFIKIKK